MSWIVLQVTSGAGRSTLFRLLAVVSLVATAGCSGGGGGTSPSESTSVPLPPPPPPCFQTVDFGCAQEAEYRRLQAEFSAAYAEETAFQNQWGLDAINAARAFANVELAEGADTVPGAGVTVGFVDTGIDLDHPLFTGSVTEEFLLSAEDETGTTTSHGTAVASVVGADFLGLAPEFRQHGFRGVAPGADLKMYAIPLSSGDQPYRPISLVGLTGADRELQDIANALLAGGVDVANLSFGYRGIIDDYSEADLRAALGNAIAAMAQADAAEKTILVWAAGNDHGDDCTVGTDHCVEGAISAVSPEILAGLPARIPELRGHALAVVAVGRDSDADGYPAIASFSNRCGIAADWCIAAPGVDVEVAIFGRINGVAGQRGIGSRRGTSFAAPMVAGGLAVMKQLFRGQLGSEELVRRLYATASKEGPFSDASVYGQGLMDLGAATSPVGRAMLTTGRTVGAPGADVQASGMVSGFALGDGLARALADQEIVAFDRLGAPFWFGLSGFVKRDTGPTLAEHLRGVLSGNSAAGPGIGQGVIAGAHWRGGGRPHASGGRHPLQLGFLGAPTLAEGGHLSLAEGAMTLSLALQGGFSAAVLSTRAASGRAPVRGLALAYRLPAVPAGIHVGWLAERRTLLGSATDGAFGSIATDAIFGGIDTVFQAGPWRLFANAEVGAAAPRVHEGLITRVSRLTTSAFTLKASRRASARDLLTVALSQPLRVEGGQAALSISVGRTPQGEVVRSFLQADLSPSGRQLDVSSRWARQLATGGELVAGATWTREPGHDARADPALRLLAGWRARFQEWCANAVPRPSREEPVYRVPVGNERTARRRLVRQLSPNGEWLSFCYEAGPCGYGLYRELTELGDACLVVAPSLIPRRPAGEVKSSRRDALMLARLHRSGELTAVWAPDAEQQAMRDLVQMREDLKEVELRMRQRLSAILLRHQRVYRVGRSRWTQAHVRWREAQAFDPPAQQIVFHEHVDAVQDAGRRVAGLDTQARVALASWSLRPVAEAMIALRRVDVLTAVTVLPRAGVRNPPRTY